MSKSKPQPAASIKNESQSIRICHLADIHLGYRRYNRLSSSGFNQREVDVNIAFQEAVDRICRLKPALTVIAGDLFHSVRPSNAIITFAFRQIRRLTEGTKAPVVIIAGNHESPKRVDSGSLLRLFTEIPNVYVADNKQEQFVFPELNLSVCCLPHPALVVGDFRNLRADDRYKFNVLVLHAQVNQQWISDFGGVDISFKDLAPHEWDYIALGHVHLRRNVSFNAAYSGSIEHTAANIWAESDDNKGFIEVELTSRKQIFHALTTPRQVVTADAIDAQNLAPEEINRVISERLEKISGGLDGKLIKLEIVNITREVFRQLDHKLLRQWRAKALNLTLDLKPPERTEHTAQALNRKWRGLQHELQQFCEQRNLGAVKNAAIFQQLETYLQQLEALDETH